MQARTTIFVALALCAVSSAPVRAGVYNTADPDPPVINKRYTIYKESLIRVRNILNSSLWTPLRENYLFVASLKPSAPAKLTWEQRLNLGACLIRLYRADEAIEVLKPATTEDPKNFLIQSNLATAYYLAGLEDRARDSLDGALDSWPKDESKIPEPLRNAFKKIHDGNSSAEQFRTADWYRRADTYFKKLLRARLIESKTAGKAAQALETVDALFGQVSFVGESGKFEPGKLAAAERAKLPEDAIEVVEQLLLWLPADSRLYWQLAELLNGERDPASAYEIINMLVNSDVRSKTMKDHRFILQSRPQTERPVTPPSDLKDDVTPPGPTNDDSGKVWSADPWQLLAVGFGTGILVAFLGYWQVREVIRRRQQRAASSRH